MIQLEDVNRTILTATGVKEYIGTEVEDKNGKWDDSYSIEDGYYVIHDDKYHHVYG